ncbi:MAG: ribonuclease Y [Limnochordaceae bacterium]|nr:ribonuclease Y [Limnochordaceae bacterium]
MSALVIALIALIAAGAFAAGYTVRKATFEARIGGLEARGKAIIEEAEKTAEAKKREALLEAKEEAHRLRLEAERELRQERAELQQVERRLLQREELLERKLEGLDQREQALARKAASVDNAMAQAEELLRRRRAELERVANMTTEEARQELIKDVEAEIQRDVARMIREAEEQAKEQADRKAKEIIAQAIQRCAVDHVAEITVSVVNLPNDEMKGRIIGREGRNIRTLETLTGIDLIIDDTPEAVILSGFDPVRREVARLALERLVADGRIHPARIEEMVEKAQKEVDAIIREYGEQAAFEAKVPNLHPELIKLLGRLKFRTSYGQNVLKHSLEVAYLAGLMASELGANVDVARRAGLLHDIGKAVSHEVEGGHLQIGIELLRRYRESPEVIHAMACHHGDYEPQSVEAVLVTAADAISAARPGARRETLESYIKRLEKLEAIADSFEGVEKAYAIQAGREIRVIVKPERIDDAMATKMAKDISKRIEQEMEYPGQIKVTVIRETRAVEYAR